MRTCSSILGGHVLLHEIQEHIQEQLLDVLDMPAIRQGNVEQHVGKILQLIHLLTRKENPLETECTRLSHAGDDRGRDRFSTDDKQGIVSACQRFHLLEQVAILSEPCRLPAIPQRNDRPTWMTDEAARQLSDPFIRGVGAVGRSIDEHTSTTR